MCELIICSFNKMERIIKGAFYIAFGMWIMRSKNPKLLQDMIEY